MCKLYINSSKLNDATDEIENSIKLIKKYYYDIEDDTDQLNKYIDMAESYNNKIKEEKEDYVVKWLIYTMNKPITFDLSISNALEYINNIEKNKDMIIEAAAQVLEEASKIPGIIDQISTEDLSIKSIANLLELSYKNPINLNDIYATGYTPQGTTEVGKYIIVAAHGDGEEIGRGYIYDRFTHKYLGYFEFADATHAGGITYDPVNNVIFATGVYNQNANGEYSNVKAYDYTTLNTLINQVIQTSVNKGPFIITNDRIIDNGCLLECDLNNAAADNGYNKDAATMAINPSNGHLYVTTFDGISQLTEYEITRDGDKIVTNKISSQPIAPATQGIVFKDNTMYTVSSTAITDTTVFRYRYVDGKWEVTGANIPTAGQDKAGLSFPNIVSRGGQGILSNGKDFIIVNEYRNTTTSTTSEDFIPDVSKKQLAHLMTEGKLYNVIK